MKNITPKNLIAVTAVAIMLFGAAQTTFAYVPGVWDPQPRVQTGETAFVDVPMEYQAPVQPQVAEAQTPAVTSTPTYYYSSQPVNNSTTSNTTTKTSTNTTQAYAGTPNTSVNNIPPAAVSDTGYSNNGLTALSVAGNGGFFPSSIWQWILVILLILIVIIIARSFKKKEEHHVAVH
jgi:hypothetical protein